MTFEQDFQTITLAIETAGLEKFVIVNDDQNTIKSNSRPPHVHDRFELRFLFGSTPSGEVDFINLKECCLIPPGTVHPGLNDEELKRHLCIRPDVNNIVFILKNQVINTIPVNHFENCSGLVIDLFIKGLKNAHAGITLRYLILLFISALADSLKKNPPASEEMSKAEYIRHCIHIYYYRSALTIASLAEMAGVSFNYIQKLFRDQYGCTPKEYLLDYRLTMARNLLREKKYLVKEVARLCGWNCQHYFSNAYRKKFGTPPSGEL